MARVRQSRLDGRPARLIALGLFCAAIAFLLWYERDRLFPQPADAEPTDPAEAAYLACREARFDDIDGMKADGVVTDAQVELFRSRADALCRDQHPPSGGSLPGS
ncbi:MAG: hypothetical protein RIB45_03960 [Marivibrio sp.]|uniref:hypothetical protein n=1 Tax=Marivibrio sp. TaxID=2039719 RepID=UPI0032EB60F5